MQVPPSLKLYPIEAARALLEWTAACTDVLPELKTTAAGIVWLIKHLEEVRAVQKEYCELELLIREFLEILIAAGRQRKGGFVPIEGLDGPRTHGDHSDDDSSIASVDTKGGHNAAPIRLSRAVKSAIKAISIILREIQKHFEQKTKKGKTVPKRSFWARLFTKDRDTAKLRSLDKRLRDAIEMFKVRAHIKHERALRQSARTMKDIIAQLKSHIRGAGANTGAAPPVMLQTKNAPPGLPVPAQPITKSNSDVVVQRMAVPEQRVAVDTPVVLRHDSKVDSDVKQLLQLLRDMEQARDARNQIIVSRLDELETRIANAENMRKEDLEGWKRDILFMHDEHHAWERRRTAELQKLPRHTANYLIDAFAGRSTAAIEEVGESTSGNVLGAIGSPTMVSSTPSETAPSTPCSPPSWRFASGCA